jgi:proteasome alpha subunit
VSSLAADGGPNAPARELGVEALEVAILDRNRALPRKFRRIRGERLAELLRGQPEADDPGYEVPEQFAPQQVPQTELPSDHGGNPPGGADQPST